MLCEVDSYDFYELRLVSFLGDYLNFQRRVAFAGKTRTNWMEWDFQEDRHVTCGRWWSLDNIINYIIGHRSQAMIWESHTHKSIWADKPQLNFPSSPLANWLEQQNESRGGRGGCDNQVGFEGKRGFLGLTGRDLGRMAEYAWKRCKCSLIKRIIDTHTLRHLDLRFLTWSCPPPPPPSPLSLEGNFG